LESEVLPIGIKPSEEDTYADSRATFGQAMLLSAELIPD